jgi:hypothetical protein
MKMIYNNKLDRVLSNDLQLLIHLGHFTAKIGPGALRLSTPIDTPICNVCKSSSEVRNYQQPQ